MWVTNYLQTRFCFTVWVLWVTILSIQWYRLGLGVHLLKDLHWKSCGLCWRSSLGWRPCVWHNLGLGSLICLEPQVESTASEYTWRGKCISSFSQTMVRWDLQSPAVRALTSLLQSWRGQCHHHQQINYLLWNVGGLDLFSLVLLHSLSLPVQFYVLFNFSC